MKRIEWFLNMILGWICDALLFQILLKKGEPLGTEGLNGWLLSWAGFYAFDNGFNKWGRRI